MLEGNGHTPPRGIFTRYEDGAVGVPMAMIGIDGEPYEGLWFEGDMIPQVLSRIGMEELGLK